MLAQVAHRNEFSKDAALLLETVLAAKPDYRPARHDYVLALIAMHRYKDAREQVDILVAAEPDNLAYRMTLASILVGAGSTEEAVALYRELLRTRPEDPELHLSLGHALKTLGQRADAERAYGEAARRRANFGDAYWSLANLKTYRFTDDELARMREHVDAPRTPPTDRTHLCFALGKALEDRGEFEESFRFYARGNALRKAESTFRLDVLERTLSRQMELCTREFFQERRGWGCPDGSPIFIVGLPRAGSTLLEQILASHSEGRGHDGAGRRSRASRSSLDRHPGGKRYPGALAEVTRRRIPRNSAKPTSATRDTTAPRHAVLHRQDAEQLSPRQPDPPDAAEREDHRRAARADGLLLQQLQAAVRDRPAVHLQPGRPGPLLRQLRAHHGSLGRGPAGSRAARPARGRHRRSRGQRPAHAGFLRARVRAGVRRVPPDRPARAHGEFGAGAPPDQPRGRRPVA